METSTLRSIKSNLTYFFTNPRTFSIGLIFAAESALFAAWLSRIALIKESMQLSDEQLGMLLFGLPLGLLILNPFSGMIVGRLNVPKTLLLSGFMCSFSLLVPAFAPNIYILFVGLMLLGASSALANVAMNTCVTILEKAENIRIMATCHGMWSLGSMLSGLLASVLIAQNIPTNWHFSGMSILIMGIFIFSQNQLKMVKNPEKTDDMPKEAGFVMPDRNLFLIILAGSFGMMAEGLAFDWSGVYLRQNIGAAPQTAALGFTFFAAAMTFARFMGEGIIGILGEKRILVGGGILAASGLLIAIFLPYTPTVLLGFAILGAGCALGAPILFNASMRLPNVAPAAGLATYATFSFLGFLLGPPLIGFVSERLGLAASLGMIAVLMCIGAWILKIVRI